MGILLLVTFSAIELRVREPLIDLRLFRGIDFLSSATVGMVSQWLFFSTSFLVTLYLQNVLGLSALATGLVFLSLAVPFVVASVLNDQITATLGVRGGMTVGTAMTGAGAGLLAFLGTGQSAGVALVSVAYVLLGVGLALAVNTSTTGGMVAIDDARAGAASGVLSSSKFVASAFGVAVVGAVFKAFENRDLATAVEDAGAPASQEGEVEGLLSGSQSAIDRLTEIAPAIAPTVRQAAGDAFLAGLVAAMVVNVVVAIAGVAIGLRYRAPTGATSGSRAGPPA